ncbi:sugar ABC transporter permease [uncultured Clostridium sp.]|uniref:carbohydrate ABC transporter permease n=1 Tax=uncultured Clostridium sp. TaxID=59620 RepID=UPI0028EA87A5|nr:sugar ABC transporter permease [uncultured Clostridium sp.]
MAKDTTIIKKKPSKQTINEWKWAYFLVAPTIIGLMILNIIPIFQTLYLSFFKSGDFGKGNIFVGLNNYKKMLGDAQVWHAVINTLKYTVIVVPVTVIMAMILAVLLNSKIKGKGTYRTIYFIPMVAAPAAITMIWKWLYNNQYGLINYVLSKVGINPINWIDDPNIALYSIIIIGIWSTIGYSMVLLIAGLQEIPRDYYEASSIDGAKPVRQFFNITLPLVSPTLFFVVVTSIIQGMQVFDVIYMMIDVTSPAYDSTVSLVYLFYNSSFKYADKGYGSAIVMLLLVIIMIITVFQMKAQKKWVNYM